MEYQFVVTPSSGCQVQGAPPFGSLGGVFIDYAQNTWNSLSQSSRAVFRQGDEISASPAVYYDNADQKITSTRIVTLSEDGRLSVNSLAMANGQLQTPLEYSSDVFTEYAQANFQVTHPHISPVIYANPDWNLQGGGPPMPPPLSDHDADGNVDDYVYVPREFWSDPTPAAPNSGDEFPSIDIASYDLHDFALNPAPPPRPRYVSDTLGHFSLTMSTPAITRQDAWQFQVNPPGVLPPSIVWYKWALGPNAGAPPVPIVPGWVVAPPWPVNQPWGGIQRTPGVFLYLCAFDHSTNSYDVAAFDINPLNLINGKYPAKWLLGLQGTCNSALTATDLVWVKNPHPIVPPAVGPKFAQEPLLVVVQDEGIVTVAREIFGPGAPAGVDLANINVPGLGRTSATVSAGLILVPYPDTALGGRLELATIDPSESMAALSNTLVFGAYDLPLSSNGGDAEVASGVATQSLEDASRYFYIGVHNLNAPGGAPNAGILHIDFASIRANLPGNAVYMQVNMAATTGHIYSTPAIVSEDVTPRNFLFVVVDGTCVGAACQPPLQEMHVTSYHN